MTSHLGAPVAGKYHPLHNLAEVAIDPDNPNREDVIATAYHELWHSLEFAQTLTEQRLLVELFPGDAAVERFLKEHPLLAARAICVLGQVAAQDPVSAFGLIYVVSKVRAARAGKPAERAFRRFHRWIVKEIRNFEKLPAVERWRQIEREPRTLDEIPFLNEQWGLVVYGPAAERACKASDTFRRHAKHFEDDGYRIDRCHMGALTEELRMAGCFGRLHGPAAAFYDGHAETMSHENRAAYAFGSWGAARKMYKPDATSIFGKGVVTMERFVNGLRGRGFQFVGDIFEHSARGRMAKRLGPASVHQTAAALGGFAASRNGAGGG